MNSFQQAGVALFVASFANGLWQLYRTSDIATAAIKQRFSDREFRWTLMISPFIGLLVGLGLYWFGITRP
jgi:hypothetical protein